MNSRHFGKEFLKIYDVLKKSTYGFWKMDLLPGNKNTARMGFFSMNSRHFGKEFLKIYDVLKKSTYGFWKMDLLPGNRICFNLKIGWVEPLSLSRTLKTSGRKCVQKWCFSSKLAIIVLGPRVNNNGCDKTNIVPIQENQSVLKFKKLIQYNIWIIRTVGQISQ